MNMIVEVTWPVAAAQPQGAPSRCRLSGFTTSGQTLCLAVPTSSRQEQAPHLWVPVPETPRSGSLLCGAMGQRESGGKENTSLSAVTSPHEGRHQLPAKRGWFSLTRYSWRWRGADGPAWTRFQPDCQGGVGGATGLAPGAGIHVGRAGATSLPSQWGLACMGAGGGIGCGLSVVLEPADAWSLSVERCPLCFMTRSSALEKCKVSMAMSLVPSTGQDPAGAEWSFFIF